MGGERRPAAEGLDGGVGFGEEAQRAGDRDVGVAEAAAEPEGRRPARAIRFQQALPRTETGKLQRYKLRA